MAGQVIPIGFRAADASGNAYSGAKLYTYIPGTTTNKSTYTTSALNVAQANPIVADSNGVFAQVWASDNSVFDLVLKSSTGTTLYSFANEAALAIDTTGGITRDFGAGGRLNISGAAGEVSFEGGPATGDDVGGVVRIGGWNDTQGDTLELDFATVSVTGTLTGAGAGIAAAMAIIFG